MKLLSSLLVFEYFRMASGQQEPLFHHRSKGLDARGGLVRGTPKNSEETPQHGARLLTPTPPEFFTTGSGTCTENLGCPTGEIAACYFHEDGGKSDYHTKCYDSDDLEGIQIGDSLSKDKFLAACGPCSCLQDVTETVLTVKVGKSMKGVTLDCPSPPQPPDVPVQADCGICLPWLCPVYEPYTECGIGEVLVSLELETDGCPEETSWELSYEGNTLQSVDFDFYKEEEYLYTEDIACIDMSFCYDFTIFDRWGDGMTADVAGYYTLKIGGETIGPNAFEDSGLDGPITISETITFGNCATRRARELSSSVTSMEHDPPSNVVQTNLVAEISFVAQMTISVPHDQHVTIDIVDAVTGDMIVERIYDGMISANSPQAVSVDMMGGDDDLGGPLKKYKAVIQGENESDKTERRLYMKPPSNNKKQRGSKRDTPPQFLLHKRSEE